MKKIVGITGGIASGKSMVCSHLKKMGYSIIDADVISRKLSEKDQPLYQKIVLIFGREYLLPNLQLDRKKLGRLIYHNAAAREQLNAITHPIIVEEIQKQIRILEENIIFLEIPLLFEAKLSYLCDTIVCVYTDYNTQLSRLMARDHISKEFAIDKISSQIPLEIKAQMSDYVIESLDSVEDTLKNVEKILKKIKGE